MYILPIGGAYGIHSQTNIKSGFVTINITEISDRDHLN